jgi:aminopeptidase-like protein
MLADLRTPSGSTAAVQRLWPLLERMYPICRSITGNGVRQTLDLIETVIPLQRFEVPTGTPAFDWEVPPEWNIRDAYVADESGRRVIDFRAHSLHVVSYSTPVRRRMTLHELQPHLHSIPDRPDWIPYRTSYYKENWGFCLRHRDRERLAQGTYDVVIDAELKPGHLTYAECVVEGKGDEFAIIYTHTCHPSLANDNLTGIAAAAAIAQAMRAERPRLTWRIVFGPGTIGSLVWLSRNETLLPRLRGGLVIGLLGDPGPLTYKRSRRGDTATDRAAQLVLKGTDARIVDFEPYGYDERQFCSPGFDLPVGRLTRSANGRYDEYHTSADDLSFIRPESLAESLRTLAEMLAVIDRNRKLLNLSPKGEPRLGKRGLYGSVGGVSPGKFEHALLWLLSFSDGRHDLVSIAQQSGLPWPLLVDAAERLEAAGLTRTIALAEETQTQREPIR